MRHVVIIGGGFGGLSAARHLRKAPVRVTLVDRANYHLFQPLLYQVAMSGLSPADIAVPIRSAVHKNDNASVILDEATSVDLDRRVVELRSGDSLSYDYLIVAIGAKTNYFGHPEWAKYALGLKDIDEAVEIRRRVLLAFEAAERELDPQKRKQLLSFVVIGGGPTGVELAGALAELGRFVLSRDFKNVRSEDVKVTLLEMGPRVLPPFDPKLSKSAEEQLRELCVEVRTGAKVTDVTEHGVYLEGGELLQAELVLWGAGVTGRPLARTLGVPLDRAGRVIVEADCSVPGHPEAFVIGDLAHLEIDGRPLPGLAPVAMQQARFVVRQIADEVRSGKPRGAFHYRDKGSMATIGRSRAVAEGPGFKLTGYPAWLAWIFVHLWFLVGFRNRFLVFYNWFWGYITYRRGARLITGRRLTPGLPRQVIEPSETEIAARQEIARRQQAQRAPEEQPLH